MLFEFLNGLFLDVSFIYVSLIILMMAFALNYVGKISSKKLMNRQYVMHDAHQLIKVNRDQVNKPLIVNGSLVTCLRITFERTDDQDNESDSSSSYMIKSKNIRGGQLCRNNSYSSFVGSLLD